MKAVTKAIYDVEVARATNYNGKLEDFNAPDLFSYTYYGNYGIPHCHDYWEFIIVLSGTYTHVLNGKTILLNKNQACMLRPHVDVHVLKNGEPNASHFTIRIKESRMHEICDKIGNDFYDKLQQRNLIMIPINDSQTNRIINYSTIIETMDEVDTPIYFLLTYILEKVVSQTNFFDQGKPQWFTDLLLKINAPQNMHWSVEDVVNNSNFSHTHLLRAFKKYEDCSLIDYLTKAKMTQACRLILYSNMSMLDIALALGYSDSSHLNRTFKKIYHISPREFKRGNKS